MRPVVALVAVLLPALAHGAGNVTVDAKRIIGDDASNRIKLEPGSGGRVLVSGFDGTTVNGLPAAFVVFGDTMTVRLREGDDTIVLQDVGVATKLVVDLGPGADALAWSGGSVGENLTVEGGDGTDEIAVTSVSIGYNAVINAGPDDDEISVDDVVARHGFNLKGGRGDDSIVVTNLALRIPFHVTTVDGADQVTVTHSTFLGPLTINLGDDDDDLLLGSVRTDARAVLDGGPGVNVYTDGGDNRLRGELTFEHFEQAP